MPQSNRSLALCLGGLAALGPLSMDMYLAAMPRMTEAFGIGHGQIEQTITMFFLGFASGQLVLGPLSDRLGRKPIALSGLFVFLIACIGCVMAGSFSQLLVWRVIQGLGGSVCMVIAMAAVRDRVTGAEADRLMGLIVAIIGIAPVVAPMIGGLILRVASWQAIFVVLAAVTTVLLLVLVFALPETLPPERRSKRKPAEIAGAYLKLFVNRDFMPFASALTLTRGTLYAYVAVTSPILIAGYGLDPLQFALVFGGNAIGLVTASQIGPRISARIGQQLFVSQVLMARGVLGVVFAVATLTFTLPLWFVLVMLFLLVASLGLAMPPLTNLSLAAQGRAAGMAAALLGAMGYGFGAVLSGTLGLVADGTVLPLALVIGVTSVGALAVGGVALRRDMQLA